MFAASYGANRGRLGRRDGYLGFDGNLRNPLDVQPLD